MVELQPCPFCGEVNHLRARRTENHDWHVVCLVCDAQGPLYTSEDEAKRTWNEGCLWHTRNTRTGEANAE